jgi:GDSL-like lipase/acylhydrolase family protein
LTFHRANRWPEKSRRNRPSFAWRLVKVLILVFVCFVLAEVSLRAILGLGNPVLITPDAACNFVLKPNQNIYRFFAHTRVNRDSMRSDDFAPNRPQGTLRLMFLGDSLTYGTSRVDQKQIFAEILHRDLPSIVHRPVEVLNASAGAWAPSNELSYLRSRGIFNADIVLWVVNDGDVGQPRATIGEVGDDLPQRRPALALGELWSRYLRLQLMHIMSRQDAGDSVVHNAAATIQQNLAVFDEGNALVQSHGARLVMIYLPFRADVPQASASSQTILRDWASKNHVPMLDLTSTEQAYPASEISLDHGVHFNAKGNAIVANAIEKLWPEGVGLQ